MKNAGFTSKDVRAALAAENSRAYLKDSHDYKGVDGRTYKTDKPLPDHEAHLSRRDIAIMKHNEKLSMKEIYRMELFLGSGSRTGKYVTLPSADRDRIAAEYPIRLNPDAHRYEGDMDEVWAVLAAKFPERAANYPKGYKQCQYALKYGEAPVTIVKEGKSHDKD